MKIVIDIPDGYVGVVMQNQKIDGSAMDKLLRQAVIDGTPLPKGHGDLKDNDTLDTIFLNATNSPNKKLSYEEISNLILDAPTIIEADKGAM